ncbi:BACON domain-containing protein [Bacteroides fragilis]|nr:BACON domain-containing protein [Bacteroides fragilis]
MKYLTFPFLLLLLPLIGFGCSSEEKETDSLILSSDSEIFFEQGIDFAATSGTRNLSFSSGRPWRISLTTDTDTRRATDWCTVSPSSGTAGDASVTISIQENTDYDSRSVKLTLIGGRN